MEGTLPLCNSVLNILDYSINVTINDFIAKSIKFMNNAF